MKPVRVFFSKLNAAKFISHLDLNRVFSRAVRRAGLPVWYTEGFNPHPFLVFALPLSLGMESRLDLVDMRLVDDGMSDEEVAFRLKGVMPDNLPVLSAAPPVMKRGDIAYAAFDITLGLDECAPQELESIIKDFFHKPQIEILKTSKRCKEGRLVDVKEKVHHIIIRPAETGVVLSLTLPCGNEENINPRMLIDAVRKGTGRRIFASRVVRERFLNKDFVNFQ